MVWSFLQWRLFFFSPIPRTRSCSSGREGTRLPCMCWWSTLWSFCSPMDRLMVSCNRWYNSGHCIFKATGTFYDIMWHWFMYIIWKLWEIDRDENITDWYTKLFFNCTYTMMTILLNWRGNFMHARINDFVCSDVPIILMLSQVRVTIRNYWIPGSRNLANPRLLSYLTPQRRLFCFLIGWNLEWSGQEFISWLMLVRNSVM